MKIKRFHSLSFKLTLWYILILFVIITLAGFLLYQGYKERMINDLDKLLLEIADKTHETWWRKRGVTWLAAMQSIEERYSSYPLFLQLIELQRENCSQIKEIISSPHTPKDYFLLNPPLYARADKTDINNLIYLNIENQQLSPYPVRTLLFPVRGPRILQVGISTVEIQEALNALILVMVGAGLLLLVLASAGGSIIIRKALHPVTEVITTAKKITADDLSLRIESKERADEIGALVETFNEMIARLERSVKKIKQFSGDVSHELRTPLTIIRGEIEVLLRKERKKEDYIQTLQSVLEEAARMEKIINDLLLLSRLEAMEPAQFKQPVDLVTIASRAINQRKELAARKGLRITRAFPENGLIKGHPELLERLVLNLLDNAIRYTPKGGKITLGIKEQNKKIEFYVADTGIGIPPQHLPYIFDRFYVADPSRSKETGGVGLGLAIVKWIADLHGAKIKVESQVNQGTQFTIYFPVE